jgi:hypothetical protein
VFCVVLTHACPIHEAGIVLYRTVMIDREAIRQRWRLFDSKLDEDPEVGCRRVSAKLADALRAQGHEVSPNTVSRLLEES